MSINMCQEIKTQSIETVKLRFFFIFFGVTFLWLVYFIQYLNTFPKIVFNFVFSFNLSISLLHFPSKLLGFQPNFRGKKRNIKNTKVDPKTRKDVFKTFDVAVICSEKFTNADKFIVF